MEGIRVANAPCSWGVLEFELEGEAAGFAAVLDEIQQSGYAGTEFGDWGFMPTEPAQLRDELAKRDLEMVGGFVPVALANAEKHEDGLELALRTARLLSAANEASFIVLADDNGAVPARTLNAGRIQPEHGLPEAQQATLNAGAETIARRVREETGLRTVFHHHCAGYVETPGEVTALLEGTDPHLLGLCIDTGHYTYGGGDALDGLERHVDRIWHVHFKDCHGQIADRARQEGWDYFEAVRNGVFCELGKGVVDFPAVRSALERIGYQGWIVVEQDVLPGMGTPIESAKRNRAYLNELGL